jgi:hypothetical protein
MSHLLKAAERSLPASLPHRILPAVVVAFEIRRPVHVGDA